VTTVKLRFTCENVVEFRGKVGVACGYSASFVSGGVWLCAACVRDLRRLRAVSSRGLGYVTPDRPGLALSSDTVTTPPWVPFGAEPSRARTRTLA
jgi:hypothetical protein